MGHTVPPCTSQVQRGCKSPLCCCAGWAVVQDAQAGEQEDPHIHTTARLDIAGSPCVGPA